MSKEKRNISSINNQYTKKQLQHLQKEQQRLVFRRRRLALVFAVFFVVFAVSGVAILNKYQKLQTLKSEKVTTVKNAKKVKNKEKDLDDEVNRLKDNDYVQKIARSKHYLSKDGEQVFKYPQDDEAKENAKEKKQQKEVESSAAVSDE